MDHPVGDGPERGGVGLPPSPPEPLLDARAKSDYRDRLARIDSQLDQADLAANVHWSEQLRTERDALVRELRAAAGFAGRERQQNNEAERARVNATRALGTALKRLEPMAPLAAAHLRASLRTGAHFRYQPAPGGPRRWRVS